MALGGEIHARVPVAGLELARKPKVPEIAEQGCHWGFQEELEIWCVVLV